MMILMAKDMQEAQLSTANVAVAIIDEPTFVGKSRKLLRYLGSLPELKHPHATVIPQLTFVLGTDTITRFFSTRFYSSKEAMDRSLRQFFLSPQEKNVEKGDGSQIACARRASSLSKAEEDALLLSEGVRPYVQTGSIRMMGISSDEALLRSTHVRETRQKGEDTWKTMCRPEIVNYIEQHNLFSLSG